MRLVHAALLALPLLAGCYASNVVAREERAIEVDSVPTQWRPATEGDVRGLFESVAIGGDAAVSLRRVYYWFGPAGVYTGAALIDADDSMAFQTLTGTWQLTDSGLVLDGAAPVALQVADGFVRIAAPSGELILRRRALQ